jgi:hypothetical protein
MLSSADRRFPTTAPLRADSTPRSAEHFTRERVLDRLWGAASLRPRRGSEPGH